MIVFVFALAVRSHALFQALLATVNPCFHAFLLNWGMKSGMFCISTIPRFSSFS